MKKHMICILGGSGFVGRHLVNQLAKSGQPMRLITRRIERQRDLLIWPTVDVVEANIHDTQALHTHFAGCDTVINLAAILNESKKTSFQTVHVDLSRNVAQACLAQGVKRLLHMSALNADARQGASAYLRSKGEGEDIAHSAAQHGLSVTSFRPSVIFGPNDHFFNRFAGLLRYAPAIPLACPDARFAPVYVGDVVHAFMVALDERATIGQRYDLCGPRTYTLKQLMEYTASVIGVKRLIIGLGDALSRIMAGILEHAPGKPLTRDNYLSMQVDSVCRGEFPAVFGAQQTSVETAVPLYLNRRDQRMRYYDFRRGARRN